MFEIFIFWKIAGEKVLLVSVGDNFGRQEYFLLGDQLRDANTLLCSVVYVVLLSKIKIKFIF